MATPATPPVGSSATSSLSDWAGGYVTDMLGKAQAVASEPYRVYQGPMTAGESGLQSKVFQGLGGLNFPSNLGQSFSSPMGGQQYGQQPYPAQIPGTGGGMPPPGGFPGYNPYAGRQGTTAAGSTGGLPPGAMGSMPAYKGFIDGYSPSSNVTDLMSSTPVASGPNWAAGSTGVTGNNGEDGGPIFSSTGLMGGMGGNANTLASPTGMPLEGGSYGGTPESMGYSVMPQQGGTAQTGMPPQGGIAGLSLPPQTSQQPSNIAQSYMNPYLQSVLDPQMAELRRQNDITNMQANAKLTGAGAFGGGRQAIMNAENNRNLMMEQNKTVGQGYANAYDKAMGQFNTEQGQARDLANLMSSQGAQQRDIEQQGISADYNEFLAQRDDPMKKTQYLQSMLQGLPISTVSNQAAQQSGIGQLASTVGGMGNIMESLKKLGL